MTSKKCFFRILTCAAAGLAAAGCGATGPGSGGPGSAVFKSADAPTASITKLNEKFKGKRVTTFAFLNKSLSRYRFLGNASSDYLLEFLQEAGFRTVEGSSSPGMKKVLGELRYGLSDMVDVKTAVAAGQHLGTDLVFLGAVTDYNVVKAKSTKGISYGGISIGGSGGSITYSVQAVGRVIDVKTREILAVATSTYMKKFPVQGGVIKTPWGSMGSSEKVEVINETGGRILQQALRQIMNKIVRRLNSL